MPPKEESNFKYIVKNMETGEESELHTLTSPISFPKDKELYAPPTIFEFDMRISKKFVRDRYKAIYKGCNNWWKMHGKRVYR